MGGLLKFIIITICVLYILRVLARIFLPFLFKKAIHKMQEKMQQQQGGAYQYQPQKKEPKLDNAGDFVDYEEVK